MVSETNETVKIALHVDVLILVLVEDGFGGARLSLHSIFWRVLILVLVEDGFGVGRPDAQGRSDNLS